MAVASSPPLSWGAVEGEEALWGPLARQSCQGLVLTHHGWTGACCCQSPASPHLVSSLLHWVHRYYLYQPYPSMIFMICCSQVMWYFYKLSVHKVFEVFWGSVEILRHTWWIFLCFSCSFIDDSDQFLSYLDLWPLPLTPVCCFCDWVLGLTWEINLFIIICMYN